MAEGGKAIALKRLVEGGFMVPPFIVCGPNETERKITAKIEDTLPGVRYFAVRSSADVEDSKEKSFAGHFYTGLGIARKDVIAEIARVRQSFGALSGSVLVQEFIPSDIGGVIFTEVGGNTVVINATPGLCQTVVSGGACDEYVCSKDAAILRRIIAKEKDTKLFTNGKIVSKNNRAYTYLPESVEKFPDGKDFLEILKNTGFKNLRQIPLTFGIASIYIGKKAVL